MNLEETLEKFNTLIGIFKGDIGDIIRITKSILAKLERIYSHTKSKETVEKVYNTLILFKDDPEMVNTLAYNLREVARWTKSSEKVIKAINFIKNNIEHFLEIPGASNVVYVVAYTTEKAGKEVMKLLKQFKNTPRIASRISFYLGKIAEYTKSEDLIIKICNLPEEYKKDPEVYSRAVFELLDISQVYNKEKRAKALEECIKILEKHKDQMVQAIKKDMESKTGFVYNMLRYEKARKYLLLSEGESAVRILLELMEKYPDYWLRLLPVKIRKRSPTPHP